MDSDRILAGDSRHIWHPYAPPPGSRALEGVAALPEVVVSARGSRLELADGRTLVDGMAAWWSAIHGYRHPVLDAALREQVDEVAHVMFGGLTHGPAVELGELLVDLTPAPMQKVFFADSGSVAVEVALKMALQHWRSRGRGAKSKVMAIRGGYHGDTLWAMSVCDPVTGMHHLFADVLPGAVFAPRPPGGFAAEADRSWLEEVRVLLDRHHRELAALIIEPVMQGAGGMWFYSPEYLPELRDLCSEHEVLLVFDEIATGFGRTGEMFAADHAGVAPDITCVGKALTGGYLSLAATLCTDEVAEGIGSGEHPTLMHGPTFMANPLACAVAGASINLLRDGYWRADVARIERGLREGLGPARDLPGVADVRVLGAVGVVELDDPVDMRTATSVALEHGVWLRPFGKLVYTTPPYVVDDSELAAITSAMLACASRQSVDRPA